MTTLFLDHQNGRIAYDETGTGPLVVCVPSMGDVRAEYRFLAPQLAQAGYRVVTMDVRGHGESSTAWDDFSVAGVGSDIVALIRHLDGGPAVVVGESMAAGATVWAAAEAPELVAGVSPRRALCAQRAVAVQQPAVWGNVQPSVGTSDVAVVLHHAVPDPQAR